MRATPIYDNMKNTHSRESVPDITANAVVENPDTRRKLTTIISGVGVVLGTVIVVDLAAPAFDLTAYTNPISAGLIYIAAAYGITVTLPNTPTRKR